MSYGLEGKLVRLAPIDPDGLLEPAIRWMNDPEVTEWLGSADWPISRLAERAWLERVALGEENSLTWQIETLDGRVIGTCGFHKVDAANGTATSGMLIGEREFRGKGYGTDAARVRAYVAFHVLGLRVLYSGYFEGNPATPCMLTKVGYRECGRLPKERWKRGAYRDHVLMYLDRETWEAQQQADVERA